MGENAVPRSIVRFSAKKKYAGTVPVPKWRHMTLHKKHTHNPRCMANYVSENCWYTTYTVESWMFSVCSPIWYPRVAVFLAEIAPPFSEGKTRAIYHSASLHTTHLCRVAPILFSPFRLQLRLLNGYFNHTIGRLSEKIKLAITKSKKKQNLHVQ